MLRSRCATGAPSVRRHAELPVGPCGPDGQHPPPARRTGQRAIGMDFQLEFGFYSYASNAAFWCFRFWSFCNKNPKPFMLKLPSAVPLDLLILRIFLVVLCIFSVLFYAGIVRAPPASVGVFPPQGPACLPRKLPEFSMFGHCESKG